MSRTGQCLVMIKSLNVEFLEWIIAEEDLDVFYPGTIMFAHTYIGPDKEIL